MCGRTVFSLSRQRVASVAGISAISKVPEEVDVHHYNLCPTNSLVCIVEDSTTHDRSVQLMKWGLEPRFHASHSLSTINARVEGVHASKVYGPLIDKHRCVVVVDGFYEWQQEMTEKVPYLIKYGVSVSERPIVASAVKDEKDASSEQDEQNGCILPRGVSPLLFAGLYDESLSTPGLLTVSVLTTESIGPCAKIHSRMPILLSPESAQKWLSSSLFTAVIPDVLEASKSLATQLECTRVSPLVNSVANKGIEVTFPNSEMKKRSFEKGLGRFFTKKAKT